MKKLNTVYTFFSPGIVRLVSDEVMLVSETPPDYGDADRAAVLWGPRQHTSVLDAEHQGIPHRNFADVVEAVRYVAGDIE
jgi:hypothetical protein